MHNCNETHSMVTSVIEVPKKVLHVHNNTKRTPSGKLIWRRRCWNWALTFVWPQSNMGGTRRKEGTRGRRLKNRSGNVPVQIWFWTRASWRGAELSGVEEMTWNQMTRSLNAALQNMPLFYDEKKLLKALKQRKGPIKCILWVGSLGKQENLSL